MAQKSVKITDKNWLLAFLISSAFLVAEILVVFLIIQNVAIYEKRNYFVLLAAVFPLCAFGLLAISTQLWNFNRIHWIFFVVVILFIECINVLIILGESLAT